MKAKEYLNQVQKLDKMIENKAEEVSYWRSIASGTVTYTDGEKVQSSGNKKKMEDAVCRYLNMENEINEDIDRLVDLRQEIIKTIEKLPTNEYDFLYKMYVGKVISQPDEDIKIKYMSLYEIADEHNKSYRWAASVHGTALANVQRILNEREEMTEIRKAVRNE